MSVFEPMKKFFANSDYVFANLESPINSRNDNLTSKQYEFCSSIEFAQAVYDSGIRCVSTANNHCMDRDYPGILETIKCLDKIGLKHAGINDVSKSISTTYVDVKGIRIAFLSYTYGTNAFSNHNYLSFRNRRAVNLLQEQEEDKILFRRPYHFIVTHPHSVMARVYHKVRGKLIKNQFMSAIISLFIGKSL